MAKWDAVGQPGFVATNRLPTGVVSRRALLAAGAGTALLAACTKSPDTPQATPAVSVTSAAATSTPGVPVPDFVGLAKAMTGKLVLPTDPGYAAAAQVYNPRYADAAPRALAQVASADDVAAALRFAKEQKVPLALRAGGHAYPGWSAGGASGTGVPPSLVIDVSSLSTVAVDRALGVDGRAVRVGAGALLIDVYRQLAGAGVAIPSGSCPSVGITGLTLGGGIGVLSRAFGLTCDGLTSVEIVTADGQVRRVDENHDPDLFWACRGGGGGQFGVVTELTFTARQAPRINTFYLEWNWRSAPSVVAAWQEWMSAADPQLWSTLKLLADAGKAVPDVRLAGTWIGGATDLPPVLDRLVAAVDSAPTTRSTQNLSYLDAMLLEAGCGKLSPDQCYNVPRGALPREPFAASSHMATHPLDPAAIAVLTAQAEKGLGVPGITEAGVSLDALGGEVSRLDNTASAFGYRDALFSVQYTATYGLKDLASSAVYDDYVRGFRNAMVPHLGNTAYVNYADAAVANPQQAYFAANANKLATVKQRYDPDGLFTQPQSV